MSDDPLLPAHFSYWETEKPVGTGVHEGGLSSGENSCTVIAWQVSLSKRPLLILRMGCWEVISGSSEFLSREPSSLFPWVWVVSRGWESTSCQLSESPTAQLKDLTQDPCLQPCATPDPLSGDAKHPSPTPMSCRARSLSLSWNSLCSPLACTLLGARSTLQSVTWLHLTARLSVLHAHIECLPLLFSCGFIPVLLIFFAGIF